MLISQRFVESRRDEGRYIPLLQFGVLHQCHAKPPDKRAHDSSCENLANPPRIATAVPPLPDPRLLAANTVLAGSLLGTTFLNSKL
jgi:hypothetical protein